MSEKKWRRDTFGGVCEVKDSEFDSYHAIPDNPSFWASLWDRRDPQLCKKCGERVPDFETHTLP